MPPEHLLKASVLMSLYSVRRERLLEHDVADRFFAAVVQQAKLRKYLSDQHFTVDGTLLEAWASVKSFTPRDGDPPATGGGGGRLPWSCSSVSVSTPTTRR